MPRLCDIAQTSGAVSLNWQTRVPLKEEDWEGVLPTPQPPGKGCWIGKSDRLWKLIFRMNSSILVVDQLYTLPWIHEGTWEFDQPVYWRRHSTVSLGVLCEVFPETAGALDPLFSVHIKVDREFSPHCRDLVRFIPGGSWTPSLLFEDDEVLLAPLSHELQPSFSQPSVKQQG